MSARSSLRAAEQRLYARMRSREAARALTIPPVPWSIEELGRHSYCSLVTWKRDGSGVPTPVWFAPRGDSIVLRSASSDGKVKRMRNNARVLVCPTTFGGKPRGSPMAGQARFLTGPEADEAEAALKARYGLQRRTYALLRDPLLDAVYIEVSPPDQRSPA